MDGLRTLTRQERTALRALLIRATADAGRSRDGDALEWLVTDAPIHALPCAAAIHRVAGAVRDALDGVDAVPASVTAQLDAVRQRAALRHLLITGTLDAIGRTFDAAGLRWVAMKGPVLAARLYPAVGDRAYADLDLLVDRRDFPDAMRILEGAGYEHAIRNWALAERMLAGQVSMGRHGVSVDLHWHLHYSRQDRRPFALDPEAMIERRRTVNVSGVEAPTLDPVDTVVTLAFHAARSDGHRLVWCKDIERALTIEPPDLDELVRRCRDFRCAPPVGLMLGRARALLDAPVPAEVVRTLTPGSLRAANALAVAATHPVQLDERPTVARALTRSVRASAGATVAALPARAARDLRRRLLPSRRNETDREPEKRRYLAAVVASIRS